MHKPDGRSTQCERRSPGSKDGVFDGNNDDDDAIIPIVVLDIDDKIGDDGFIPTAWRQTRYTVSTRCVGVQLRLGNFCYRRPYSTRRLSLMFSHCAMLVIAVQKHAAIFWRFLTDFQACSMQNEDILGRILAHPKQTRIV